MKTKKLKTLLALLITCSLKAQIQIPPTFFGLNYWFTNYTGAPFTSSLMTTLSSTAVTYNSATGAKLMRAGGTAYNLLKPLGTTSYPSTTSGTNIITTPAGYVKIVDDVRAAGFEPMVQVPFDDLSKTRDLGEQAYVAAEIVREVNIVHKRNIKFWIIGNEPTDNQGYGDSPSPNEIRKVRDYIKKYSVEMKKIDPDIKIIGPELTGSYNNYLNELFSNPSTSSMSISGTIPGTFHGVSSGGASGKYFVDFASIHSYPGFSSVFTSTTDPIRQRYVNATYSLTSNYQSAYNNTLSASHNSHLAVMLDEFNMSGSNTAVPASTVSAPEFTLETLNANTFLAGQQVAGMMGAMLTATRTATTTPYQNCNLWSVAEGDHFGYINGPDRKPSYWHYWLMAKHFKGTFYKNLTADPGAGNIDRCY